MLFELDAITKTYGSVIALDRLSISVPDGAVGLLGPNGAGKTTLIRALLGLVTLDSGRGRVLDRDIRTQWRDIRQAVGFVPEDECLFPAVPGVEFVSYAGQLCGMSRSDALQRAHEMLNHVGLGEARYRPVESYSTGMKQRIKLAAAVVHDPRLLVLDEPTNGLDPAGRLEMLELARDLARGKGMSLLFSSHLLPDVEFVCEYVVVLGRGRLLAQGKIAELKDRHDHGYELQVKTNAPEFARRLIESGCAVTEQDRGLAVHLPASQTERLLWELAAASGEQIRYLRPQKSTLEEVFLEALN